MDGNKEGKEGKRFHQMIAKWLNRSASSSCFANRLKIYELFGYDVVENLCFSSSCPGRHWKCRVFPVPFLGRDRKCCVFPIPFLQRVRSAVFFQFPFSFPVPFQFPSSSLPVPFPVPFADSLCFSKESALQTFFFKKENIFVFSLKKSATHFPWKNIGNPRRELGRELGRELEGNWERERELEKHSTSYTLKKRNWKNTAFSITPEKGNWKNTAFSMVPGKGNWKNTAFPITPEKGNWKNTAVASTAGKGTGKTQSESRTNTDVKQESALAQYLSVHHHYSKIIKKSSSSKSPSSLVDQFFDAIAWPGFWLQGCAFSPCHLSSCFHGWSGQSFARSISSTGCRWKAEGWSLRCHQGAVATDRPGRSFPCWVPGFPSRTPWFW